MYIIIHTGERGRQNSPDCNGKPRAAAMPWSTASEDLECKAGPKVWLCNTVLLQKKL